MNPEHAKGALQMFLGTMESEFATSKKVIAAVPQDKSDYKPDPKSMSAFELAKHIPGGDNFFLDAIISGDFKGGDSEDGSKTIAEVLAAYEISHRDRIAKLTALSGEQLAKPLPFFGIMELPAVMFLQFMLLHTAHHRGQLSAYLRPMGAKVPQIYGGSADEPMQMPAQA